MPCEHQVTRWEASLFQLAETSKETVGFDGHFSLPDEQRVLLEVAEAAEKRIMVQVLRHLKLTGWDATALLIDWARSKGDDSVEDIERQLAELQRR